MVVAIIIVEMMGKPSKFLRESMEAHIKNLDGYSEVEIKSAKISEPKEYEVPEDKPALKEPMYTCFAEIEFEVPNFSKLTSVVFDFMPSSVEVVEPFSFQLESGEITDLLNNLSGRLHRYDEIAKMAHAKISYLENALKEKENGNVLEKKKSKDDKKKVKKKAKKAKKK